MLRITEVKLPLDHPVGRNPGRHIAAAGDQRENELIGYSHFSPRGGRPQAGHFVHLYAGRRSACEEPALFEAPRGMILSVSPRTGHELPLCRARA